MDNKFNLKGKSFGRLTVIENDRMEKGVRKALCLCDCGEETDVNVSDIRSGNTKSCGCLYRETRKTVHASHGMRRTRLYSTWTNMKTRCYNPDVPGFKNYGGRGITVCEEWKSDFVNFYNWAVKTGYNDELTIERVDVNGNYEPENCMWIGAEEQSKNRRVNIYIELNGKTETLREWCNKLGLPYKIVHQRMKRGNLNPKENLKWYMNKYDVQLSDEEPTKIADLLDIYQNGGESGK